MNQPVSSELAVITPTMSAAPLYGQPPVYAPVYATAPAMHPLSTVGQYATAQQPSNASSTNVVNVFTLSGTGATSVPSPGPTCNTVFPNAIAIVHKQPLDDRFRFLGCPCVPATFTSIHGLASFLTCGTICNCLCWESKLRPRAYAAVMENRVELNYPLTCCCGMLACDDTRVEYFDKMQDSDMTRAESCTPFHCCCCVACTGQVAATACCDLFNCCLCNCCRSFYAGLSNADAFVNATNRARGAFSRGQRLIGSC